jgi:hypothetical protein
VQWLAILRGYFSTPLRGRFWDERTGSIKDTQAIGEEIFERNDIMTCQDLIIQLQNLNDIMVNVNANLSAQAVAQATANNILDIQNTVIAQSNATASSTSSAIANLSLTQSIVQQIVIDARPYGGQEIEPSPEEGEEIGIDPPNQIDVDYRCDVAYWLVESVHQIALFLRDKYAPFFLQFSEGALSLITAALRLAAWRFPNSAPVTVPASAITALVQLLVYWEKEAIVEPALDAIIAFLENPVVTQYYYDLLGCYSFDPDGTTASLADEIVEYATVVHGLNPAYVPFLGNLLTPTALAFLIYEPLGAHVPARPAGINCDCGE